MPPSIIYFDDKDMCDVCLLFLQGHPDQVSPQDKIQDDNFSEVEVSSENSEGDAPLLDMLITDDLLGPLLDTGQSGESHTEVRSAPINQSAVQFKLDSRRFRRVSPVFDELLDRHVGSPGHRTQRHPCTFIPLWNDDPSIMSLILGLLDQDQESAPSERQELKEIFPPVDVQLSTLVRIAATSEKYKLYHPVEQHLAEWTDNLWKHLAGATIEEGLAWIWISWVFKLTDYFEAATSFVAKNATEQLADNEQLSKFPIPRRIIRAMGKTRLTALSEFYTLYITFLDQRAQELLTPKEKVDAGSQGTQGKAGEGDAFEGRVVQKACGFGVLLLLGSKLMFWPECQAGFTGLCYAKAKHILLAVFEEFAEGGNARYTLQTPDGKFTLGWLLPFATQFKALIECTEDREWSLKMGDFQ